MRSFSKRVTSDVYIIYHVQFVDFYLVVFRRRHRGCAVFGTWLLVVFLDKQRNVYYNRYPTTGETPTQLDRISRSSAGSRKYRELDASMNHA